MHYINFAIFDRKIEKKNIYNIANEILTDDLSYQDASGKETYLCQYCDWFQLGGRFKDFFLDENSSVFKKYQKWVEKSNKKMNWGLDNKLCKQFSCRKITKKIYDKIMSTENDELLIFDYVNQDILNKDTFDYNKIKGHWITIIDMHN